MNNLLVLLLCVWLALFCALLFIFLRRFISLNFWTPLIGSIGIYSIIGSLGFLYYRYGTSYLGGFYDIGVSNKEIIQGLISFLLVIMSTLIGALLFVSLTNYRKIYLFCKRYDYNYNAKCFMVRLRHCLFLALPLLFIVVGFGFENILYRQFYIDEDFNYTIVAGKMFAIPAVFLIGYFQAKTRSFTVKLVVILLLLSYGAIFLSLSSRRIVLLLLFYIIGLASGGCRQKNVNSLILMWVAILPYMLEIPLKLRVMSDQGLIVLFQNIKTIIAQAPVENYVEFFTQVIKNIAFGVPLSAYVGDAEPISIDKLIVSINPLPSFVSLPGLQSWYSFSEQLRVTRYIPFNAIGELYNHGWIVLVVYFVFVGAIMAWVDMKVRIVIEKKAITIGALGLYAASGLLFLFAFVSTQYNLRSSTRLIYYSILIVMFFEMFEIFLRGIIRIFRKKITT